MVHLSPWCSWLQQLCMNGAEESCCPQRLPSPKPWQGWSGDSLTVLGSLAAGQCLVSASCLHSPGCSAGNWEKGNVSWREGTTTRLDRASEKCAVSRAGQGREVFLGGKSAFTSILCPPSVQNVTPLEEHCLLIIADSSTTSSATLHPCQSLLPAQGQ